MAKDNTETSTDTDTETATVETPPTPTPTPTETTAGEPGALAGWQPSAEERAQSMRANALQMASYGGIHEAKEPIAAILARAEAYRAYMETGETGIVA